MDREIVRDICRPFFRRMHTKLHVRESTAETCTNLFYSFSLERHRKKLTIGITHVALLFKIQSGTGGWGSNLDFS